MTKSKIIIIALAFVSLALPLRFARAELSNVSFSPNGGWTDGQINEIQPLTISFDEDGTHGACSGGGTVQSTREILNVTDNAIFTVLNDSESGSYNYSDINTIDNFVGNDGYGDGDGKTYRFLTSYSDDGGNCAGLQYFSDEFTVQDFIVNNLTSSYSEPYESVSFEIPDLPYLTGYGYDTVDVCVSSACHNYNLQDGVNNFAITDFTGFDSGSYDTLVLTFHRTADDFTQLQYFGIDQFTVAGSPPPPPPPDSPILTAVKDGDNYNYNITDYGWDFINTFYQILVFAVSTLLFLSAYSIGKSLVRR